MAKILNVGDLREFLCSTLNQVANGTCDISKAREITKLASQVNESFYSEVKVASTQVGLGREAAELGKLKIK